MPITKPAAEVQLQCAGTTHQGQRCQRKLISSLFCSNHEYFGAAECIGGGPLDGWCIYRNPGWLGDAIAVGRTTNGKPLLLGESSASLQYKRIVHGIYAFEYEKLPDGSHLPVFRWKPTQ